MEDIVKIWSSPQEVLVEHIDTIINQQRFLKEERPRVLSRNGLIQRIFILKSQLNKSKS